MEYPSKKIRNELSHNKQQVSIRQEYIFNVMHAFRSLPSPVYQRIKYKTSCIIQATNLVTGNTNSYYLRRMALNFARLMQSICNCILELSLSHWINVSCELPSTALLSNTNCLGIHTSASALRCRQRGHKSLALQPTTSPLAATSTAAHCLFCCTRARHFLSINNCEFKNTPQTRFSRSFGSPWVQQRQCQ